MVICLGNVLVPLHAGLAIVSSEFDEEVLSGEEWLQFHFNLDVLGLWILIDALKVVVLDELARSFVVAEEVVDGLLQLSLH